jgi:hypothetical protein
LEKTMIQLHRLNDGKGETSSGVDGVADVKDMSSFWKAILVLARERAKKRQEEEQFERAFEKERWLYDEDEEEEKEEDAVGETSANGDDVSAAAAVSSYDLFLLLSSPSDDTNTESKTNHQSCSTKSSFSNTTSLFSSSQERALNMILSEPEKYLVPRLELVVLPPLEHWQALHSCVPDHTMVFESQSQKGVRVKVIPSPDITKTLDLHHPPPSSSDSSDGNGNGNGNGDSNGDDCEEKEATVVSFGGSMMPVPTISRIDTKDMDLLERTEALELRGLHCNCIRCIHERHLEQSASSSMPIVTPTSSTTLRLLARVAAAEGRYHDAEICLVELSSRHPNDSDLILGLSRLYGWNDEWTKSRSLLLQQCATKYAGHPRVIAKLSEANAYNESIAAIAEPSSSSLVEQFEMTSKFDGNAHVTLKVLSTTMCTDIVAAVETHQRDSGGWTTSRHYAVPTTDVPVHQVPQVLAAYNTIMKESIAPMLGEQCVVVCCLLFVVLIGVCVCSLLSNVSFFILLISLYRYSVPASSIRTIDAFVVKYDASKQRSLPLHCDQSEFSLTIALNSLSEYDGGGTYFAEYGEVLNCESGGVISFRGDMFHGGHPITKGVRYILVAFLYSHLKKED